MDKILVDADGFIAQFIKEDANHLKAVQIREAIKLGNFKVYVVNLVIAEVSSLLSRRFSQEKAVEFLNQVEAADMEIIYIDEDLSQKTINFFKTFSKKNISFVDCANLIVAREKGIPFIFSFDKFYGNRRFSLKNSS